MLSSVQALGSSAVIVAVAIRVGERRVVESLQAAGSVDPGSASRLPLRSFVQKWQVARLLTAGVIGETMDQAQYLKLPEYIAYRRQRRKRALVAVVVIAVVALSFYFVRA